VNQPTTTPATRAGGDQRPGSDLMTGEDTRPDGEHDQPRLDAARPGAADVAAAGTAGADSAAADSLIAHAQRAGYRIRWAAAQRDFIDEPRTAVTDADTLVGAVLDQLAATFRTQRTALERQLPDNDSSTADLRITLRRYRTFFNHGPSLRDTSRMFTLPQSTR
jgi:hypothetical protein